MSTVTYKNQPGIHATRGTVPTEGTRHPYRVGKILWPEDVENTLNELLIPKSLHVCCGKSRLGDLLVDIDRTHNPNIIADAARLPFKDQSFQSTLCDPPYNGRFQWNHDLLSELARVTEYRIIFQHWFMPIDSVGQFKKYHAFRLRDVYVWQPRTYFGRVQVISVMERV